MTDIRYRPQRVKMCFNIPSSTCRASAPASFPGFNPLYTNDHYSGHDTLFGVLTESQNLNLCSYNQTNFREVYLIEFASLTTKFNIEDTMQSKILQNFSIVNSNHSLSLTRTYKSTAHRGSNVSG